MFSRLPDTYPYISFFYGSLGIQLVSGYVINNLTYFYMSTANSSSQSSSFNVGLALIAVVASLGGLLFGYDTGVINGTQFYFSKYFDLDAAMKGWVVGSALLGCLIGAASSGIISNSIGRKNSLIMSALLFTVSAFGSGLPSFYHNRFLYWLFSELLVV